jgi:hypothetical protein
MAISRRLLLSANAGAGIIGEYIAKLKMVVLCYMVPGAYRVFRRAKLVIAGKFAGETKINY